MSIVKKLFTLLLLFATVQAQDLFLRDGQSVVILGNSITQSGAMPFGYVNQIRNALSIFYPERVISVINAGISGHKAPDMHARFQRDVLQYKPDWVAISVGINDVWHGFKNGHTQGEGPQRVPLNEYTHYVTDMIKKAQQADIKVALMTTTIIKENLSSIENKKLHPYNKAIHDLAEKFGCLLIDQRQTFIDALQPHQEPGMKPKGRFTTDGVHMNHKGNWLMTRTFLQAFGISKDRLVKGKNLIAKACGKEQQRLQAHRERYAQVNYEVGPVCQHEERIVFYGSSSVDRWNLADDFPNHTCLNRGIGGEHTRDMVRRFKQDVVRLKPYAMILFLGSCNDFFSRYRYSLAETKSNLLRMSRVAAKKGIKVALGAVSPVNDYVPDKKQVLASHPINNVQALNRWIKSFCKENDHIFIDFYWPVADASGKLDSTLTEDGMHVNAKGYEKWQAEVHKAFQKMGIE